MADSAYKSLSVKTNAADEFDSLASVTGLTKSVLLRKLLKLGRKRIAELLLIDVPLPGGTDPASSDSHVAKGVNAKAS